MDIEEPHTVHSRGSVVFIIKDFSKINKERVYSPPRIIYQLPWKVSAGPELRGSNTAEITKYLGVYLECNTESASSSWCCFAKVDIGIEYTQTCFRRVRKSFLHLYHSKSVSMGFGDFMAWNDILDPKKGFIKDDQITVHVWLIIYSTEIMTWGCLGTNGKLQHSWIISTEERNLNYNDETFERFDFIVENFTRLKTQTVFSPQIVRHNFPWRIGMRRDSSNEFLALDIICHKKSQNSWKFLAEVEIVIVSQKYGVRDHVQKLVQFYSEKENTWGFSKFMKWNNIIDPENGFIKNDIVMFQAVLCVYTHSNTTIGCIDANGNVKHNQIINPLNDTVVGEGSVIFVLENFSEMKKKIMSSPCTICSLSWVIQVSPEYKNCNKYLGFYLQQRGREADMDTDWSCFVHVTMTIISQKPDVEDFHRRLEAIFHPHMPNWGYPQFMKWKQITDPRNGYIKNDRVILKAHIFVDIPRGMNWDSKHETGFIGLKNQPGTCFLNSLLRVLYFVNKLRKTIYQIPTENDYDGKNLVLALQRTFYKLEISDEPVSTAELTKCLRHEAMDIFMPDDLPQFLYLLFNKLDTIMKNTGVDSPIKRLFEFKQEQFITCTNIGYETKTFETLYSVQLEIKHCSDIEESFADYTFVDNDDHDTGLHGFQNVEMGTKFTSLPAVLILNMNQFEYHLCEGRTNKYRINKFEFSEKMDLDFLLANPESTLAEYTLLAALAHTGDSENGHFVVFINPKCEGTWYEFDDDIVSQCAKKIAVLNNINGGPGRNSRYAYTLVYVRDSELKNVLQEVIVDDIPAELRIKFDKELEAEHIKREEHIQRFINVNVLLEDCFDGHQGHDLFDLAQIPDPLDHEGSLITLFKVKKDTVIDELLILLSTSFGRPLDRMRIWPFDKRTNGSYRPTYFNVDDEKSEEISKFATNNCWNLFLELLPSDLGDYPLPRFNHRSHVLLFFKLYNPRIHKIYYCEHCYFSVTSTYGQLVLKLNEKAGYPPDTELILFKEIAAHFLEKIVDPTTCNNSLKEISNDLSTGDIIVFQKDEPTDPLDASSIHIEDYFLMC